MLKIYLGELKMYYHELFEDVDLLGTCLEEKVHEYQKVVLLTMGQDAGHHESTQRQRQHMESLAT